MAVSAVLILAVVFTLVAYAMGPLVALAACPALAVAVWVMARPEVGIYLAILAVPGELATAHFGSSFSLSPTKALLLLSGASIGVRYLVATRRPSIHLAQALYAGFLGVMTLGIIVATDPLITERLLTVWVAVWIITVWVAACDREQIERIFFCIAISGAVLGLLALSGSGPQVLVQGGAAATGRASSSFTHPNQLGDYMVLALPATIVLISGRSGWLRWALLLAVGLQIGGLVLTLARGAIFGAVAAGAVLLLWGSYRRLLVAGLCAAMIAFIAYPSLIDSGEVGKVVTRLGTVQSFSTSTGDRLMIWSKTPALIADHPLIGIGAGNFPLVSPHYGILGIYATTFDHAHDVLLTIAAETGLLGLVFFVAFGLASGWAGLVALRSAPDRRAGLAALALLAAYVGTFVISLTDYPLEEAADYAVMMIEGAMLIALARQAGVATGRARRPSLLGAGGRLVPADAASDGGLER